MLCLFVAMLALAGPADDLLAKVDKAANQASDAHVLITMATTDKKGRPVERTVELWQKGDDKRLIQFNSPARLAGTAMLVPDGDTIYLYLPAYDRARRFVGESRGDAFIGTDFAMEDLARTSFAAEWSPAEAGLNALTLTPQEGVKTSSARIELKIREGDFLPSMIEHYDAEGSLMRRITFDDVREVDGVPLAHSVTV